MEMGGQLYGPAALSPRKEASRVFMLSVFHEQQRHTCLPLRLHVGTNSSCPIDTHTGAGYIVFCFRNKCCLYN